MIKTGDAANTILPEPLVEPVEGHDVWLFAKVSTTLERVDSGDTKLYGHMEAISLLRERLKARLARTA